MNILVISHEYPPIGGGGATACFFLTREMAKRGHHVELVTAQYESLQEYEITENDVGIHRVKCKRKLQDKSSLFEMFTFLCSAFRKVRELTKKRNYDKCVVFFGIPSGPIALYLKWTRKIPYIVRLGGGDIPGAQKRFKYVYAILSPIIRAIWRNADYLVANSEGLKERAELFEKRYPITVIPNGVDSTFFTPVARRGLDCINILFVSRLIEGKGLQFIIPELPRVRIQIEEQCGKRIELTIVGDGPYRAELERIAQEQSVQDIVHFMGRRNKEQVREFYQKADVFILPSLSEGMPNVVLEAMACGLPVIMTPCEGSKELITDNGIITPIDKFADQLVRLCVNEEQRGQMGQNSVHNVKTNFRWEQIAQQYMKILA